MYLFAILDNRGRHVGTTFRLPQETAPETTVIAGVTLTLYFIPLDLLNRGDL